MKKFFILAIRFFALALFSSNALAVSSTNGSITLKSGDDTTKVDLSANVAALYNSSGAKYSAATVNSKGTQEYGTASDTTYIFYNDVPVNTATPDAGTSGDSNDFLSKGWKSIGSE